MLRKLSRRLSYANVMSTIAVFLALGGSAYAVNTVRSTDIVDGEVKSADVKDESLTTFDVSTFLGSDVVDGTLTSDDIKDFSLGNGDFLGGSVDSRVVTNDSLTGTDINESTLNMPPSTTVGFVSSNGPPVTLGAEMQKVLGRNLPAGSYALIATANLRTNTPCFTSCDIYRDATCELRDTANNFLGGAKDRRLLHDTGAVVWRPLSMNGGAQLPAGGGQVSLWCNSEGGTTTFEYGQIMIIRTDGFF
jgi:hypothetical protein